MTAAKVSPPILYKDDDLERLVAAVLAAGSVYVERGLEFPLMCEADVIGTRLDPFHRWLAEAKSGKCGASDAFKFESQRRYLSADSGAMVVPLAARVEIDAVATWGGFEVIRTDLTRPNVVAGVSTWLGWSSSSDLIDAWERAFTVIDRLVSVASDPKNRLASATLKAIWTAFHGVNAPAWVRMDLDQRCKAAYDAFAASPQASLAMAREIDGSTSGNSTALFQAWSAGQHEKIQACMLLEWLNRIEVVRLAAEYALTAGPTIGTASTAGARALPIAFRKAVMHLRKTPRLAAQLPVLFQAFIFRWGGFLIPAAGEEAAIGAEFGLSAADVAAGLAMLDTVFPPASGPSWFRDVSGARWLLLVPYPIQGLGVTYRDAALPGWDATFSPTLSSRTRGRETAAKGYL